VLIAHNGINFDYRFLNKKLEQSNMPLLKNAIVDTMQISRAINTDLRRHSLGVVARYYKINYDEAAAHRADFDVSVLYSV
jgi:DNA polymerase-3 subunit alpha (Gram-positive type)